MITEQRMESGRIRYRVRVNHNGRQREKKLWSRGDAEYWDRKLKEIMQREDETVPEAKDPTAIDRFLR